MLKFTEEQEMIRETAQRFAQKDVEPVANEIDQEEFIPDGLLAKCAELGLYGLFTSEEYGGSGQNLTSACLAIEEISKASPSLGGALSVQVILCPAAIAKMGTEDQKKRFLVPSASGEEILAWSMSEPVGATNLFEHQTTITRDGNGYRLNGLKIYCTQGNASNIIVFGRSKIDDKIGYGAVVVEKGMDGFEPSVPEDKLGWRGTNTGTIVYNNIYIPPENILSDPLKGLLSLGASASLGTLGHCASALGCVEGMFDKTVAYVKDRNLYGAPQSQLQPMSYWIAECWTKIQACRAMLYALTASYDEGRFDMLATAACKAYLCDTAFECTSKLLQMWGGAAIMNTTGINRYFRDARTKMIAEGPSETHYDTVARAILEQPHRLFQHPRVGETVFSEFA